MKIQVSPLIISIIALLSQSSLLFAQSVEQLVEVSGGARVSKTVEALIKVDFEERAKLSEQKSNENPYFVIAKLKVYMSSGNKTVSYVDAEINSIGFEVADANSSFSMTALNVNWQRNIDIGISSIMRVSFVGFRGKFEEELNSNLKFLIEGAVDLAGVATIERLSDYNQFKTNDYYAGRLEAGLEINRKFKIMLGVDGARYWGDAEHKTSVVCDQTGACFNKGEVEYNQTRSTTALYLKLFANLNKNLRVFTQLSQNTFRVDEKTGRIASSKDKAIQIQTGLLYIF